MSRTIASLAVALLALPLAARAESSRLGSFELGAGTYRPDVDADYVPPATGTDPGPPYARVFGTGRDWAFRAGVSRAIFTWPGALEVGFRTGFFRASARSLQITNGVITDVRTADKTAFNIVPTSLTLTYRLDLLWDDVGVPLVPYARASLERYNWWMTGEGTKKSGATNGYSFTGGVALVLDFLDRGLARELDADSGINHTYVFVDVTKTKVDDFGSKKSWDLSDEKPTLAFGLMFVF